MLDPFKPYLNGRLAQGERNATLLLTEITGQGYTGGYNTLARYLRPLRRLDAATLADLPPHPAPPTVRKVAGWITGLPSNLDPGAAMRLHAIRARCPELDAAVRHVAGFARMMKDLSGDRNTLTKWIGAVDADLPPLRSFTVGLRRDLDAVVGAVRVRLPERVRQRGFLRPAAPAVATGATLTSPGSPCTTTPVPSKAPSTASSNSRWRCTDVRNPTFCASGYSWPEYRT